MEDQLSAGLVVASEHTAGHDEVGAAAEGLCEVAGAGAAAVSDNVAVEAVRRVSALYDGRELRVADAGLVARRAHRAGADTHLDGVRPREQQLLHHLARHDVAGDDAHVRVPLAAAPHVVHEVLGVAVGDVDAEHLHLRALLHDLVSLGKVGVGRAEADRDIVHDVVLGAGHLVAEADDVRDGIVLVHARDELVRRERLGHLEGARRVHVRHHDGHTRPLLLRVAEGDLRVQRNLRAAAQRAALRADEHILEVKLRAVLDAHHGWRMQRPHTEGQGQGQRSSRR
mmetsp:Transcript_43943/g.138109  ORF Transcript_43943/g.138109 Transcript_43943/m.138109 type:complete len:284 (-) Transcript_43943:124-975(-)